MIRKYISRILNIGIDEHTDPSLKKNFRVMNTMAVLVLLTQVSSLPISIFFYQFAPHALTVCLIMLCLISLVMILAYHKKLYAAAVLSVIAAMNNITMYTVLIGTRSNVHFLMPAIMIGAFYYFPFKGFRTMFILIFLSLADFFFLEYWFAHHQPLYMLPDEALFVTKIFVNVMIIAITFGFMYYGYTIYRKSESNLIEERAKLKKRNEDMETEVEMARKIQLQLIPEKAPWSKIAVFYQPMDKVGGDFYDFIRFRDDHKIGIFISDVSGHGVPATFVTSMIKSTLLQIASRMRDPAEVLSYLNDILLSQTAGNFVTAFYGIYDALSHNLTFANAGHNLPLLINTQEVTPLPALRSGVPLCVASHEELGRINKAYRTENVSVKEWSHILFYTDGLTEAVPVQEKKQNCETADFESVRLKEILSACPKLSAEGVIHTVYEKLVNFRGTEEFDDDICMVCLNITER